MAITTHVMQNGARNLVVKYHISGEAADYADQLLVDISALDSTTTRLRVDRIEASLVGFAAFLDWDATTDTPLIALPEGEDVFDFTDVGGITSDAGAGATGDIFVTTTGMLTGDFGTIVLHMKKS